MARLYLATDDEITSIIEKLQSTEDKHVVLVIPKGASLLQSVINIRLLKKKADELHKTLGIVTNDTVSKHLASQVGLSVYQRIEDVPQSDKVPSHQPAQAPPAEPEIIHSAAENESNHSDGVKVKQYERKSGEAAHAVDATPQPEISDDPPPPTPEAVEIQNETASDAEAVIVGKVVEESADHEPHRTRLKPARRPLRAPKWIRRVVVLAVLLLVIGAATAAAALPQATVTLHVPVESVKKSVNVMVDTSASEVNGLVIPGIKHQASADASADAKSTGKKAVGEKAKGNVTMSNSWSTEAQHLPKNTALVASERSVLFRTLNDSTIPGATVTLVNGVPTVSPGKIDVVVEADQPGDQYNIGPAKFTVQGYAGEKATKITGQSTKAMSGGTTKELTVVAAADIEQAKKDAKAKVEQSAIDSLKQGVPKEEFILTKITTATSQLKDPNHAVGDEADAVSVSGSASSTGTAVRIADLESALRAIFQDGLPSTKSVLLPDLATIDWEVADKGGGKYELAHEIEGQLISAIDQKSVQQLTRFRRASSIGDTLKDHFGAEKVEIDLKPAWWPLMPVVQSRIIVRTVE